MKIKDRISLNSTAKRGSRKLTTVLLAVVCALAVGLGVLGVYTALTVTEQQRLADTQAATLTALESQLAQVQGELAQNKQDLESARSQAEADASSHAAQLADRDKTIQEQQATINDLKTQIALKNPGSNPPILETLVHPAENNYPGKKLVALTFDDGPGAYTGQLLDLFKKEGVKATFFVLGSRVSGNAALIKRMADEGHEIGNHSQNHKNLAKLSTNGVANELNPCAEAVKKITGFAPTVMRCPGGSCNDTVKAYAAQQNIPIIYWTVDTRDWESRNSAAIMSQTFSAKTGVRDGSIVLLHDIHKSTVDTMPQMIERLKKEGYTFVTVTELLKERKGGVTSGKVYS